MWERILPEDGIVSFYQAKHEQLEDGTYDEEYFILTDKYLFNISITANQLNSKAYLFKPYCIEKNFKIFNDFEQYSAQVDEVKIFMEKDDKSPIIIKMVEKDRYNFKDYLDFIGKLV
jgi:hypothetical protein